MSHLCNWNAINGVHLTRRPVLRDSKVFLSVHQSVGLPDGDLASEQRLVVMKAFLVAWMLWACPVAVLALLLLVWQCWPALVRQSHCAWCSKMLGIMRWYPRCWSSTICNSHARRIRVQLALRCVQRMCLPVEQAER